MQRLRLFRIAQWRGKIHLTVPLLLFSFLLGMAYGVLMLSSETAISGQFIFLTQEYTLRQQSQTILELFFSSFSSSFFFIALPYFSGYSAVGQPVAFLVPCFKGLGLGAFMGDLYLTQGIAGVGYCLLVLMPYLLIALFSMMIACRESFRLSNLFFFSFAGKNPVPVNGNCIRLYNVKFLILCGLVIVSAIVSVLCTFLFSGWFVF